EVVLPESTEHFLDYSLMFLFRLREDKDIHVPEHIIHEVLERCRSIRKSEGHDLVLEVTIAGAERGFPFVSLLNTDVMISPLKV
ncbi:hypothetical protein BOTBODRAFT_76912, partial [Botryobasidium botryosum FD-172 SS1]